MELNCKNRPEDQVFIEDTLNKHFYMTRKTVAAHNHLAPDMYDFSSINEALHWVKMIGAEMCAVSGIELVLSEGVHVLVDNSILGTGLKTPGMMDTEPVLYLRDINLQITGSGTHQTKFKVENDKQSGFMFENMKLSFEQLSFEITSHISSKFQMMYFVGSEVHINATGFSDFGLKATYGSTVKFSGRGGSAGMCSSFTDDKHILSASMNSFIHVLGVDFFEKERIVEATENSYIYMYHNYNDEFLTYNIEKNKLSKDMSLIYDHAALGVYTTNLRYIIHEGYAEIFNSAGDGFNLPVVTDEEFGLMTPDQKIKLDNIKPQIDDHCPFNFQIWNAEAEANGQTTFLIHGFSVNYMKVFSNGVLVKNSEYTVDKGYDEMVLIFKTPRKLKDWIAIEYIL